MPSGTESDLPEVRAAIARGEKIQAIKLYRERTGVGLKEAKDAVERMESDVVPMAMEVPGTARMGDAHLARVRERIAVGDKIGAIKLYRDATGVGLKEAKDAVERMAEPGAAVESAAAPAGPLPEQDLAPIRALVASGQKIEAIKLYRQRTGLGLKEAKDAVDLLETASGPASPSKSPLVHPRPLSSDERARMRELVRSGQTVEAERVYGELTGEGTRQSRDAVVEMARTMPGDANQRVGRPVKGCLGAFLGLLIPLP